MIQWHDRLMPIQFEIKGKKLTAGLEMHELIAP
jgi:hypothetical protein